MTHDILRLIQILDNYGDDRAIFISSGIIHIKKWVGGFTPVKLNPKTEKVSLILKGLERNLTKYGELYCPCKVTRTPETICPCLDFRTNLECCCQLYFPLY